MFVFDINQNLHPIICIAIKAGRLIADLRHSNILNKAGSVDYKQDCSPVTIADREADYYITQALKELFPDMPVISEEADNVHSELPNNYFLIDPLDGTRDYIDGTPNYCVNIALISHHRPFLGIIYIPEKHQCYYAIEGSGSFKIHNCDHLNDVTRLKILHTQQPDKIIQTISSRANPNAYHYFDDSLNINETKRMGSAIKFCMIADNQAHLYPRPGQTGEWDTAAGDLIITEAGGVVLDKDNKPLIYGKENFMNKAFYAAGFKVYK